MIGQNPFMAITLKAVNRALKHRGHDVELVRGKEVFYFVGPDADKVSEPICYIPKLSDISVQEWVELFEWKMEKKLNKNDAY